MSHPDTRHTLSEPKPEPNPLSTTSTTLQQASVVDDLSAYIISGAVSSDHTAFQNETDGRTPAQGIEDGVDAEHLGFARVFLSERWDIKQADVILSAVGARTTRLGLATGVIDPTTRHPWNVAALGATMQACFGARFVLGLGRGDDGAFRSMGLQMGTQTVLADYVRIIRQLWAGETVSYNGPAGTFPALRFSQTVKGPPPPVWHATFANPRGARLVAESFDGVILPPMITPEATARAIARIRQECERIDRDPHTLRICQPVITTPDLDDIETRTITAGRAVGYLQYPGYGDTLAATNQWDRDIVARLRAHPQFANLGEHAADLTFQRHELADPSRLIPDSWMRDTCAVGSTRQCVQSLRQYRDAGADEVVTYGSTPRQNAALIHEWRAATTAPAGAAAANTEAPG